MVSVAAQAVTKVNSALALQVARTRDLLKLRHAGPHWVPACNTSYVVSSVLKD